jgi:ABC-type antimicrobial peptide transport system permease subunit
MRSSLDAGGAAPYPRAARPRPWRGSPEGERRRSRLLLARAQQTGATGTAKLNNEVNTIYVSADSASSIPAVQQELTKLLPTAAITDQNDLASQVTGSVGSAASLANNLGKWLSVAVLVAAFGLAILLTMSAVARRVREFGTLKALGWRGGRIVGQVVGESLVIGVVGGAAGVALGYGGAALIDKLATRLSAIVGSSPPTTASGVAARLAQQVGSSATHTVYVTLTAPVTLNAIGLAVVLALAGGLLAGAFGGWRAARLRPAAALRKVEWWSHCAAWTWNSATANGSRSAARPGRASPRCCNCSAGSTAPPGARSSSTART